MDPFRWTYHFDVVVFSDPRMFLQILRPDPDAYADYFLVWGDYRCPRPGLDFLCFLQVGDTGSQPMRRAFLYGVGIRKFSLDPQSIVFLFGSVPSYSHGSAPFYNNRNICFY
jgi:hypothetical protein